MINCHTPGIIAVMIVEKTEKQFDQI